MELIGVLLPPVIDLINTNIKNTQLKWLVTVAICAFVGVVLNYGQLNLTDLAGSTSAIFLSAQAAYKLYWEKSEVRKEMVKRLP